VTLSLKVIDFHGKPVAAKTIPLTLKANSSASVFTGDWTAMIGAASADSILLHVALSSGGTVLSQNLLYFKPVKDLALPKPAIKTTVTTVGDDIAVGLTSPTLVKNLCLSHDVEGRFSDNYFDMLPNEPVIVRFTPAKPMTVKAFQAGLSTMHMAEIEG
jgi:beta-mannosidase